MSEMISAVRLAPDAAARLEAASSEAGSVHSVFARAVNIAWRNSGLLVLHGPGTLRAPFAIALERAPTTDALRPRAAVWRTDETLETDGLALTWRGATIAETAMPGGPEEPPSALLTGLPDDLDGRVAPALRSPTGLAARSRLAEAFTARDAGAFARAACGLLGLGEGLTPAGDDYLVGALAVTWRFAQAWRVEHAEIEAVVGQRAATATTAIAGEFVTHALAGHFAESLRDLLTAESPGAVAGAAAQLRGFGATSGGDTLAGVRDALCALGARAR